GGRDQRASSGGPADCSSSIAYCGGFHHVLAMPRTVRPLNSMTVTRAASWPLSRPAATSAVRIAAIQWPAARLQMLETASRPMRTLSLMGMYGFGNPRADPSRGAPNSTSCRYVIDPSTVTRGALGLELRSSVIWEQC